MKTAMEVTTLEIITLMRHHANDYYVMDFARVIPLAEELRAAYAREKREAN